MSNGIIYVQCNSATIAEDYYPGAFVHVHGHYKLHPDLKWTPGKIYENGKDFDVQRIKYTHPYFPNQPSYRSRLVPVGYPTNEIDET